MNILAFPGFIVLADRNTIMKAGKRYKNTKAMIAGLTQQERERTLAWTCKRYSYGKPPEVVAKLDFRARMLRMALYDTPSPSMPRVMARLSAQTVKAGPSSSASALWPSP